MTESEDRLAVAIFEGWNAEVDGELISMKLIRADGREHNYSPYALATDAVVSLAGAVDRDAVIERGKVVWLEHWNNEHAKAGKEWGGGCCIEMAVDTVLGRQ